MKIIITLILSAFLLTSCSNPDTSGGVTLHKFGPRPADARDCWPQCPQKEPEPDEANNTKEPEPDPPTYTANFPHGSCIGPTESGVISQTTGCGWFSTPYLRFYVMPGVYPRTRYLKNANLAGANLARATLPYDLSNTNLSGADLSGANLNGVYLWRADLSGADLSGADLSNAILWSADLSGAKLSGVRMNTWTECPNWKRWGLPGHNCGF